MTNLDIALKVGLGVGFPLGLLLLATITYLVWELRKQKAAAEELKTIVYQNTSSSAVLVPQIVAAKYMYQEHP